jgi:hypothetical protein
MDGHEDETLDTLPKRSRAWVWGLLLLAVLGAGGYGAWRWKLSQEALPPVPDAGATPPPVFEKPHLSWKEGETLLRMLAAQLSSAPEWAAWLKEDSLLQRFVGAVNLAAEGKSPAHLLGFLRPANVAYTPVKKGRKLFAPPSRPGYDRVVRVVTSIDASAAGHSLQRLMPYLDSAFSEIAPPGKHFDASLDEAIRRLRAAPIPPQPVPLVETGVGYAYQDPALEGLDGGQKLLLRLGAANEKACQAWLAKLADGLHEPPGGSAQTTP